MSQSLVTIIIVLLTFFLVIVAQQNLFAVGDKVLEGKECQASLALQKAGDFVPYLDLENTCQTIIVDIPEKKAFKKRDYKENEDVSRQIARKLTRSWDIVLKGSITDMWSESADWSFFGGEQGCMVIYEINLNYIPDEDEYTQKALFDYIAQTNYKTIDGLPSTYLQYIQSSGTHGALYFPESQTSIENPLFAEMNIKEHTYAISVISPKNNFIKDIFSNYETHNVLIFTSLEYAEETLRCQRR